MLSEITQRIFQPLFDVLFHSVVLTFGGRTARCAPEGMVDVTPVVIESAGGAVAKCTWGDLASQSSATRSEMCKMVVVAIDLIGKREFR